MTRRTLFASGLASALAAPALSAAPRLPIKKAVLLSMLPTELSFRDRFQLAADCGFEQVEAYTVSDLAIAEEIRKASELAKVPIHSVMNSDHWKFPLSSGDPEVVAKCRAGMETSIRNAKLWGAQTVLLVPAVVDAKTSYADAWKRSQTEIRKLIPLAQESKVIIAVEEVWNKFLTSPLEFATYIDEFKSPWVKAYFDIGNCMRYGWPEHWARTLGKRIIKLDIKEFSVKKMNEEGLYKGFVDLWDGDVNWKGVMAEIRSLGYTDGWGTAEITGGGPDRMKEIVEKMDRIYAA